MEIGSVLLRDRQYVWHERTAFLSKDAVLLRLPKNPKPMETFPLDGRYVCDPVVVSSAHPQALQLHDQRSGTLFLVDAKVFGRKQMWIDIFRNAHRCANVVHSSITALATVPTSTFYTRITATLGEALFIPASGQFLRARDLQDMVEEYAFVPTSDLLTFGEQWVREGLLECCCCAHGFSLDEDKIYRIATVSAGQDDMNNVLRSRRGHCHALQDVIDLMLYRFEETSELTADEIVQTLLTLGAYNEATAIALANKMVQQRLIARSDAATEANSPFTASSTAKYVSRWIPDQMTGEMDDELETNSRRRSSPSRMRRGSMSPRMRAHVKDLQMRYDLLFNVFGGSCALVLFDIWASVFPAPLKLAVVLCLLVWLFLSDGSATVAINIQKTTSSPEGGVTTTAFFSQWRNRLPAIELQQMIPVQTPSFQAGPAMAMPNTSANTSANALTNGKSDAVREQELLNDQTQNRLVTSDTKAHALVQSFRQAIAEAASMPVEATLGFPDDYLLSVVSVKGRAFDYAVKKMAKCLEWRVEFGVASTTFQDVKNQLVSGSMYWYGYDFQHRPILWVRPLLKDWKNMSANREIEIRAHVFLIELGCQQLMPPGCTTFTLCTDSANMGLRQVDLRLMHGLLDTCVANYPDRVGMIHGGPLNAILRALIRLYIPLLPSRLRNKVQFMKDCAEELAPHMSSDLIPFHMGGSADHVLRATPSSDPNEALDIDYMIAQQKRRMRELNH